MNTEEELAAQLQKVDVNSQAALKNLYEGFWSTDYDSLEKFIACASIIQVMFSHNWETLSSYPAEAIRQCKEGMKKNIAIAILGYRNTEDEK